LVFIEVKTRNNRHFGYPEDSISSKKVFHIINSAQNYISQYDIDTPWRIDILAITRHINQEIEIHHIVNAIQQ
jgi:putative endonuclease